MCFLFMISAAKVKKKLICKKCKIVWQSITFFLYVESEEIHGFYRIDNSKKTDKVARNYSFGDN